MKIIGAGQGTTSKFSRALFRRSPRAGAWFDRMTYRPYKGAHRGWFYALFGKRK